MLEARQRVPRDVTPSPSEYIARSFHDRLEQLGAGHGQTRIIAGGQALARISGPQGLG
jgi:hypothetical protein